jgi:ribosome-associated toxin RatA of RatAB toxin-antitoxin module
MADVKKNVLVHHSADQMFNLVDRIEDYPLFLPWCGGSKVLERNDEITKASIHIKYSGVNQSFTTQNTKDHPYRIDLKLIDGPFKVLQGFWIFTPITGNACNIEFHLHYEFSNFILDKLISPIFSKIANTFVDGFVTQADKIYPTSHKE